MFTYAPTPSVADDSTNIATTAYVKNCVPKSVGGTQRPVYTNSNGVITACTATGANGGLEGVSEVGDAYIRYVSGWQICWGGVTATSSGTQQTFGKKFSGAPRVVVSAGGYTISAGHTSESSTGFKATTNQSNGAWVTWIAIGKWK